MKWLAALASDVVVNTLPGDEPGSAFGACLPKRPRRTAAAVDISYVPPRTGFLRRAGARGWREVEGLDMLLEQGREAFRLWFGRKPELAPLKAYLRKV